ncbi:MAG: hypothetical protein JNJ59_10000, partial [Deltaproteobacteria bacterium]|nr:hypothetical protein [Deltaproteobacteria bacterium]
GDPVRPGEPATPPPDGEKPGELADYLGRKLRAEARGPAGSDHHLFELKATGFFSWQISAHDGVSRKRAGRWKLGPTQTLDLVYRETTETPDPAGGPPRVELAEGLKRSVPFRVDPGGLVIDGLGFR